MNKENAWNMILQKVVNSIMVINKILVKGVKLIRLISILNILVS